jgi:hypothetical protein
MMSNRRGFLAMTILRWALLPLCLWLSAASAHQDPCHRLHVCSSDHNTYVCGDKGRCDQCPDYPCCLADKPRVASLPAPAPAPTSPSPGTTTTPSAVTVCFTHSENCTDAIVQALGDAKRTIPVQAYSFTSARSLKPCSTLISAVSRWRSS